MNCLSLKVFFLIFSILLLCMFPSLGWGALIMKSDGSAVNVSFDSHKIIQVETSFGIVNLNLSDIKWMAGSNIKKIRINSEPKLIVGEIINSEVTIKTSDGNVGLLLEDIVFLFRDDIDLNNISRLTINESGDGYIDVRKQSGLSKDNRLLISLLPHNWSGSLFISNVTFSGFIGQAEWKIDFNISDASGKFTLTEAMSLDTFNCHLIFEIVRGNNRISRSTFSPIDITIGPESPKPQASIRLGALFAVTADDAGIDEGFAHMFMMDAGAKPMTLGNGNVIIFPTASNIIKIPLKNE